MRAPQNYPDGGAAERAPADRRSLAVEAVRLAQQKREYQPRCARDAISAFLLSEADVGPDQARLRMAATPSQDSGYLLDGVQLCATDGVVAELRVAMARGAGRRPPAELVDIGAEPFAMSVSVVSAEMLRSVDPVQGDSASKLTSAFCKQSRVRVDVLFTAL